MWKSQVGCKLAINDSNDDDDWETDSNYINNMTEEEQRYGYKREIGAIK